MLISFAVTAKLICVFVFAYAKIRFSHNAAHMKKQAKLSVDNAHIPPYESNEKYRNNPKFLDRQVWANSADPDQTAPRGAV